MLVTGVAAHIFIYKITDHILARPHQLNHPLLSIAKSVETAAARVREQHGLVSLP